MSLYRVFTRNIFEIYGSHTPKKLAIALSGGVDSIALTSVASKWAGMSNTALHTYIIDHGLRPESYEEAQSVQKYVTDTFGVHSSVHKLESTGVPSGRVEEWARDARRSAFYRMCREDGINSLLMAHHFDDQRELFVQRLLSGSQWPGLAGMRQHAPMYTILPTDPSHRYNVNLVRPFLDIPKSALIKHCENERLKWWEDPTNHQADYTQRNLIRKYFKVTPIAAQPDFVQPINSYEAIKFFGNKRDMVSRTALQMFNQLQVSNRLKINRGNATALLELSVVELEQTPIATVSELLYRIAIPLSPANSSVLGHARHKLHPIAEKLRRGKSFEANVVQVHFQFNRGKLHICREQPRRAQLENVLVFKASHEWSRWVSLDNRWSFRWKLPVSENGGADLKLSRRNEETHFDVRFVKDPTLVMKLLVPNQDKMNRNQIVALRNSMKVHPMLKWSDSKAIDTINSNDIIGFPTLGLVRGLEVECVPKECMF